MAAGDLRQASKKLWWCVVLKALEAKFSLLPPGVSKMEREKSSRVGRASGMEIPGRLPQPISQAAERGSLEQSCGEQKWCGRQPEDVPRFEAKNRSETQKRDNKLHINANQYQGYRMSCCNNKPHDVVQHLHKAPLSAETYVVIIDCLFVVETILQHPDPNRPFIVQANATDMAVAAVLLQKNSQNELMPCAYVSKMLMDT
ncbi:hypothetical protein L345_09651, partial [Ophiophagus hannah]